MHSIVGGLAVHGRVGGREGRVYRGAVEVVVLGMDRCRCGRRRRIASGGGGRVSLRHLSAVRCRGRRGRPRRRGLVRCRVGCRLNLRWAGLGLEDGVVAQAVTLALSAVAAGGVGFVALEK